MSLQLDLKTKITAWEVASFLTLSAAGASQYGWQGALIGPVLATFAYGSRYFPRISLNFNSRSGSPSQQIPLHVKETLDQAREHLGVKQEVSIHKISNDEKTDWTEGTIFYVRPKLFEKEKNAPLAFITGHELSHISNSDGLRRGVMILPAFAAMMVLAENITNTNDGSISISLSVASAIYAACQTAAFFHHSRLVEQRCDTDGLEFADSIGLSDSFENTVRRFVSFHPEERLEKGISNLRRLFAIHPEGWERFERMERNHFSRDETPIADRLYAELSEQYQISQP